MKATQQPVGIILLRVREMSPSRYRRGVRRPLPFTPTRRRMARRSTSVRWAADALSLSSLQDHESDVVSHGTALQTLIHASFASLREWRLSAWCFRARSLRPQATAVRLSCLPRRRHPIPNLRSSSLPSPSTSATTYGPFAAPSRRDPNRAAAQRSGATDRCGADHARTDHDRRRSSPHQRRMRLFPGSYIGLDETSAGMRAPATSMLKPPSSGFGVLAVST